METDEETTEVNMNLIDAFENGHALLPLRPDLLLLPSDLKPFIKVCSCVCVCVCVSLFVFIEAFVFVLWVRETLIL